MRCEPYGGPPVTVAACPLIVTVGVLIFSDDVNGIRISVNCVAVPAPWLGAAGIVVMAPMVSVGTVASLVAESVAIAPTLPALSVRVMEIEMGPSVREERLIELKVCGLVEIAPEPITWFVPSVMS
jgi:hypothetical protein